VKTPLAGNTYTVNSAQPTAGLNFQTFAAAMDAMECGISGPVVLNVVSGSGPYNEQIIFPTTWRHIGHEHSDDKRQWRGAQQYSVGVNRAGVKINGADHIHLRNLTVNVSNTTGGASAFISSMMPTR
jgi:pectin methylesterase-like acyl-CoA thioesterase